MSGFVAATANHDDPNLREHLAAMSQRMRYRGDNEATDIFSNRCGAVTRYREQSGYRVDTFATERFAIVLDGLIFNKQELIQATGSPASANIAQIVLHGYEQDGERLFAKLDGSFALMITDLQSGEVLLARDRFAHRPLYFGLSGGNVWVANEIKSILAAPGVECTLNEKTLYSAIGYGFTPGPQTLFKGIYKCVPGFVFKTGGPDNLESYEATDYLTPSLNSRLDIRLKDAKEFILATLRKSVLHYMAACPEAGVLLSGGVDSALLAHLAGDITNGKSRTFSFGAEGWDSDESTHACALAEKLGLPFERTCVSLNDDLLGSLRQVVAHLEEPTRFENALAVEITAQNVKDQCSALITGEGADFLLGEREHLVVNRLTRILQLPGIVRAVGRRLPLASMPFGHLRGLAPYFRWKSVRDYGQRGSANCCDLVPGGGGNPPENDIGEMLANVTADWPVGAQYTFMTLREAAHCWIERMEKISAAAGIESFHPFESNDMLQFGLEMPNQLRSANGVHKPAVRSLAADLFGDEVAYRKKKQLAAPMQLWLNKSAPLRAAILDLRHSKSRIRNYLDNEVVDRYLETYEHEGAQNESTAVPLFRMLTFEIWLDMFN